MNRKEQKSLARFTFVCGLLKDDSGRYGQLRDACAEDAVRSVLDPEVVREQLADMTGVIFDALGWQDTAENAGVVGEWITSAWPVLGDYLAETTDREGVR